MQTPAEFASVLPIMFGVAGIITLALTLVVRFGFRRGKDITDL